MELAAALVLLVAVFGFIFLIRPNDLPLPEPVSPTRHLEERKSRIYEGLRDLQFEFRLGKLSDEDYQRTKLDLQKELSGVLAEIEHVAGAQPKSAPPAQKPAKVKYTCPYCSASFDKGMKFCGECGKEMSA